MEIDERSERLSAKIRDAQLEQIPLMLVIGDQEAADKQVNVRRRDGEQKPENMSVSQVIDLVRQQTQL